MATKTQATARATGKPKARERPGGGRFARLEGLKRTIQDLRAEWRKITWPDRETTRKLTLLVIALATVLGLVLGGVDALFVRVWNLLGGL